MTEERIDRELISVAMVNSYRVLIEDVTFDEILDEDLNSPFLFSPNEDFDVDDILSVMLSYFCTTEEYERCAKIKTVQDGIRGIKD